LGCFQRPLRTIFIDLGRKEIAMDGTVSCHEGTTKVESQAL